MTFALGKGLHLAANSVSNVADPEVADAAVVHLWNEVVGHLVWCSGLFVVLLAVALSLRGVRIRVGVVDLLVVGGLGLVLLAGWGAYWFLVDGSVFPQVSELGWI